MCLSTSAQLPSTSDFVPCLETINMDAIACSPVFLRKLNEKKVYYSAYTHKLLEKC